MGRIVVYLNMTLDGVVQAPGAPEEDKRGGFQHGGWAASYADEVQARKAGESMATTGALLLGRRTYEAFYAYWPHQTDNPYTDVLNESTKYVASTTLREPLPWSNSVLLKGDVPTAVAELKAGAAKDIVVLGSTALVHSLMAADLVDEYTLMVHPVVLGSGRRLFPEGRAATLDLVEATPTTTGVVIATYQPKG